MTDNTAKIRFLTDGHHLRRQNGESKTSTCFTIDTDFFDNFLDSEGK